MGKVENRWRFSPSRRRAFAQFAAMFAASPLLKAQIDPHSLIGHKRVPRIDELVDAFDFEALCYRNMTLEPYDYMAHGDGSEFNLRRNRQAFDWVDIVQGKAIQPASVDMSSVILGVPMKFPIFTAPSSGQGALHPDGEIGMYRGATAANALAAFASGTSVPHQKIAPAATGPRWQQFYPIPDLGASAKQLQMFQDLGAKAIIITVDQQASVYERDLHDRHLGGVVQTGRAGGRGGGGNAAAAAAQAALESGAPIPTTGTGERGIGKFPSVTKYRVSNRRLWYSWEYIDEVRKVIKVPVILKGIVTAEDAELCVKEGVDGIIVSNHGGRSMDYGPSTLEVLPEIVAVVNRKFPVMIDSGFRRGSDVFKALALGADAVALGRASRWGLGAFGAPGVQRLLEVIQAELVHAAAYAGRATLKSIDKTAVKANFV
jgi:isopentenyl diphosphate isomerase/L-lactate dehydrogenase-like FMN-dependent dehydrogenase